jgi:microcystin-dependent protein
MNYVSNIQIGAIAYFVGGYAPVDWMFCDGRSLPISSNSVLHAVFGGKYGEDALTFNVPNVPPLLSNGEALPAIFIAEGMFPDPIQNELCFITPEPSDGDVLLGMVVPYEGSELPMDWAWCDGSMLKVNTKMALCSLTGFRFGGDANNTFALPNLPGHIICVQGAFPCRVF